MSHRMRVLLSGFTVLVDVAMVACAFYLGYRLRGILPFPSPLPLGPFRNYFGQLAIYVGSMLLTFFLHRLYHPRRGSSRIDLFYAIVSAVSIATVVSMAFTYLIYQNEPDLAA